MARIEFKLDFRNAVPEGFLPSYKKATSAYVQTLTNPPQSIGFRQLKQRGVFMISVEAKDAPRLENQKITYNYGPHDRYAAKIKLENHHSNSAQIQNTSI